MKMKNKKQKIDSIPSSAARKKMNLVELIPGDIIHLIFSKLPFFNLPNCRSVCKSWNNLVLNLKFDDVNPKLASISKIYFAQISPYYSKLHCFDLDPQPLGGIHTLATFSFHPSWSGSFIKIINSVNGLFFCSLLFNYENIDPPFELICILNPITNECIKLNSISEAKRDGIVRSCYGFGFNPKTKQYKIVRYRYGSVYIFAFGTSTTTNRGWTRVAFVPFTLKGHGVYFNGALYWVGVHLDLPYTNAIFRFDLEHEKFDEIPFPNIGDRERERERFRCFRFFGVFNDTLYLTFGCQSRVFKVWKMEQHSCSSCSSWIEAFDIPIPKDMVKIHHDRIRIHQLHLTIHQPFYYPLQLIKVCEDGKILCLYSGLSLILYDPTTGRSQTSTLQDFYIKKLIMVYQIESFNFDPLHKILAGDVD